jgi:pyruvate dehydrogenase E2 component (dihydrolipoamide acetyltransferase)
MIQPITLPKLGQMTEESRITRWLKQEGEKVSKGDILFEMETDKAVMEVESFFEGTLLKIAVSEGSDVPVLSIVGYVGEPGDPIPELKSQSGPIIKTPPITSIPPPSLAVQPSSERSQEPQAKPLAISPLQRFGKPAPAAPSAQTVDSVPLLFKISPRAAKLAKESVIDPARIVGTGPGGRVIERDVKSYLEARGHGTIRLTPAAKRLAAREDIDVLNLTGTGEDGQILVADVERAIAERPKPLTKMRQVIAQRLTQSFTTTPHFFVTVPVDMTALVALRVKLKAEEDSYTVNDFILKAVALTLPEFPDLNSTTDGKNVQWHSQVCLGLAVSLEQGLVVPVIRGVDVMTLQEIHDHTTKLAEKARTGKLTPDEMRGSTFTISNMGMLNVENFMAIINPGESAILAVSSIMQKPVVQDEQVVARWVMKMTLSADHRIIDGAMAARFLNRLKNKLEDIKLWKRLV